MTNSTTNIHFDVPAYSQFLDVKSKTWQDSACGIASLKMILDYWRADSSNCDELIELGLSMDGFIEGIGWKHAVIADIAKKFGLQAKNFDWARLERKDAFRVLQTQLADGPVIASIHKNFQKGTSGHLVVISGMDIERQTIFYNDPIAKEKSNIKRSVDIKTFLNSWKQRVVVVHPNTVQ